MSLVGIVQRDNNKSKNKDDLMVTIPFTPLACAVVITTMLVLTFYVGRFYGMKKVLEFMKKEMKRYECKE
jgi:hypothetical protein